MCVLALSQVGSAVCRVRRVVCASVSRLSKLSRSLGVTAFVRHELAGAVDGDAAHQLVYMRASVIAQCRCLHELAHAVPMQRFFMNTILFAINPARQRRPHHVINLPEQAEVGLGRPQRWSRVKDAGNDSDVDGVSQSLVHS